MMAPQFSVAQCAFMVQKYLKTRVALNKYNLNFL